MLSAAAPDLDDDKVTTQAASGAEVAVAFPLDDGVVSLSEEFFPQFFVGDTVNLAALSKAVNVSDEFLASYVFEYGLGQPVSEIQAAAALESDQLVTQAVAAREEEVSHFQKLGPLLQEKILFFVKEDDATRVVMASPVSLFLRSLSCHPVLMFATMGSALMLDCLLRLLVFFLIAQFVSFRGFKGVFLWTFQGSGSVAFVEQFGVGQRGTNATNVGSRAVLAAVLPGALLTLIPKVWLVLCLKVFPVLRLLTRVWCMAFLGRGPPPKRSQTPPTSRRGPTVSPKPPPGAGTGYVRFDDGPLTPPPAPLSAQPVAQVLPPGPPARCAAPLPVRPVVDSVADQLRALELLSSFMDYPEVEALRSRLVHTLAPVPSEPVVTSHRALGQELADKCKRQEKLQTHLSEQRVKVAEEECVLERMQADLVGLVGEASDLDEEILEFRRKEGFCGSGAGGYGCQRWVNPQSCYA